MAYKFYSVKENNTNKETAYILYMMMGSFFKKAVCTSRNMENKLRFYYQQMKEEKQEEKEEKILKVLEKEFSPLQETLAELMCEVKLGMEDGLYTITFYTGFEDFKVFVDYKGNFKVWHDSAA